MAPRQRSSLLLVALALLGGCSAAPPRQPVGDEVRRALDLLDERRREFVDLRALADVVVQRGGEPVVRFTGVLLAKAPDSMRLEALSPLGQPLLLVVVHEGRLTAYDVAKNEARVGPATAETIGQEIGLPLEPDDLVAVLAGRATPPPDLRVAELLPPDGGGPSLNLIGGAQRRRVWVDLQTGAVRQVEIGGGRLPVTITYRRDGETPRGFDFSAGREYVTGSVIYRNVMLGGGIDPERFTLSLPKGAKIQHIR